MFGIGLPEVLGIMLVVGLLFGAKKLPEMFKSLGEGLKEFKKATHDNEEV
jgi:sec-independent protein translocase protein TatA